MSGWVFDLLLAVALVVLFWRDIVDVVAAGWRRVHRASAPPRIVVTRSPDLFDQRRRD